MAQPRSHTETISDWGLLALLEIVAPTINNVVVLKLWGLALTISEENVYTDTSGCILSLS